MCRDRPGAGPAPVPSSTSLVPLASLRAACVCCGVQLGRAGCAVLGPVVASTGAAARVASRVRRERLDWLNVSVTVSLPEMPGTLGNSLDATEKIAVAIIVQLHVRYWPIADMAAAMHRSAFGGKADIARRILIGRVVLSPA